jgi:Uma2 family endonuclease
MAIQTKMTAAEFLQRPETNRHVELIDGEIVVSAPKASHQRASFESAKHIEIIAPHGIVFQAPQDVYLDESNVVQPDVMWNGPDSQCILIDDSYWRGAPDLVLEILSPSNAAHDKRVKFQLYEKHGVREYWIMDIPAHRLEVWQRANEKFVLHGIFGTGEIFVSAVLGDKTVEVSALFGA